VQVGLVNDRVFLVNASLGLYPRSLEVREEQTQLHGRSRLVAVWAALVTIFRGYRPMRVRLERGGSSVELRTLTLFVTNNRLQLEQMGLDPAGGDGKLTAIVLRPVSTFGLLRLFAQGAMGQLAQASGIDSFELARLSVTPTNRRVSRLKIATDGEIAWMNVPIEFCVAPEPLLLLKPIDPGPQAAVQ
jgi:diacylglycerol kinase family enzyme